MNNIKISLNETDLQGLMEGKVVSIKYEAINTEVQVILQDIGYDKMIEAVGNAIEKK